MRLQIPVKHLKDLRIPTIIPDGRVSRVSSTLIVKTKEPLEQLIDRKMTPKSFIRTAKFYDSVAFAKVINDEMSNPRTWSVFYEAVCSFS